MRLPELGRSSRQREMWVNVAALRSSAPMMHAAWSHETPAPSTADGDKGTGY